MTRILTQKRSAASYKKIAQHYRECLQKYGDSTRGMDWPREADNILRFKIMSELFRNTPTKRNRPHTVLDFGCGTSHYFEFLQRNKLTKNLRYIGVDILEESISLSKKKFPKNKYICCDILQGKNNLPMVDYIVINGVFTQKRTLTEKKMKDFLKRSLIKLFPLARKGLAFNTLSNQVDFKRKGSFHLSLDWTANFLTKHLSRNFVVRHDYGLYENTFFIYKKEHRF